VFPILRVLSFWKRAVRDRTKRPADSCIPRGGNVFAAFLLTRDLMKRKKGDEDDIDVFGESEDEFNEDELNDDEEFDEDDLDEDDEFSDDDEFDDDDEFGGEDEYEGDEDFDAFGENLDTDR